MSSTAANSTTRSFGQQGATKQATTCRDDLAFLRSAQQSGQPFGQSMCRVSVGVPVGCNTYPCSSGGTLAKLNYLEIMKSMDRWSAQQKKGKLTDTEIKGLIKEWYDRRMEGNLNKAVIDREMQAMEAKLEKYNVEQLGEIPIKREDGTMRKLVCQMGGCTGKEVRRIKMSTTENLIQKYDVNLAVFMKLNFNWTKVNTSANLASWLHQEERET
jgi:hypothetical protein